MRRLWWAWFVGCVVSALPACGTYGPVDPTPPTVEQPPPVKPPVDPPPDVPPPADLTATLDRIVVGATLAEVIAAIGSGPSVSPANDGGPPTARWFFTFGETRYMVYVVFLVGKVRSKGAVRIEVVK